MKYLWTEDKGAGLHFWQLVNQYWFQGQLIVESKGSNQGLLDAVRELKPQKENIYYIAFDIVYDNMDVVNKLLELQLLMQNDPEHIKLLDITCFEHIILSFSKLIEWTGTGRKDKIEMREHILNALKEHRIDIESIDNQKTINYLMGFKHFSAERVVKSLTYELTDGDDWSVKGAFMGECWYKNCCVLAVPDKAHCNLELLSGEEKFITLLNDKETQRIVKEIQAI